MASFIVLFVFESLFYGIISQHFDIQVNTNAIPVGDKNNTILPDIIDTSSSSQALREDMAFERQANQK